MGYNKEEDTHISRKNWYWNQSHALHSDNPDESSKYIYPRGLERHHGRTIFSTHPLASTQVVVNLASSPWGVSESRGGDIPTSYRDLSGPSIRRNR